MKNIHTFLFDGKMVEKWHKLFFLAKNFIKILLNKVREILAEFFFNFAHHYFETKFTKSDE